MHKAFLTAIFGKDMYFRGKEEIQENIFVDLLLLVSSFSNKVKTKMRLGSLFPP
jgi:hypothetical protein